ncbi:hypothetical protein NCS57_00156500 [Fusarium keratoplasticum]|uniref:Uncharacterized protein n=1 Tax=Fusarium keratoplasticum TaxID=1328300 RepID=A0ACC0RFJ8_9HYPO|nr:hypothetical protein NCS57_00156500 [Fusarium keratoplasticum]KAI8684891.1 hypothetical protein NCS57_00156500 [Fusarium keratoplasticum]
MEESDTINVAAGSARTQHPSSIQIRIQIDGSVVQSDQKVNGIVEPGDNLDGDFARERLETVGNEQDLILKLGAVQEENVGLKAYIQQRNEDDAEHGFEPLEPSYSTMKQRATDALYHSGIQTVKRMKAAKDTHLNLEGFRAGDACALSRHVNFEVLHVAARAGLVDYNNFDVGPNGTLDLTELGLKKVAISEGFISYLEVAETGAFQESAQLTAKARKLMDIGGFWMQGHRSLLPLKDLLNGQQGVTPASFVRYISEMYKQTAESLMELLSTAKTFADRGFVKMLTVRKTLIALYSQYENGRVSAETNCMLNDLEELRRRRELSQYLFKIAFAYFDLVEFSKEIVKGSKLPLDYATPSPAEEELTRSLAARRVVSNNINSFLEGFNTEE